jgi:hypothetical protein
MAASEMMASCAKLVTLLADSEHHKHLVKIGVNSREKFSGGTLVSLFDSYQELRQFSNQENPKFVYTNNPGLQNVHDHKTCLVSFAPYLSVRKMSTEIADELLLYNKHDSEPWLIGFNGLFIILDIPNMHA